MSGAAMWAEHDVVGFRAAARGGHAVAAMRSRRAAGPEGIGCALGGAEPPAATGDGGDSESGGGGPVLVVVGGADAFGIAYNEVLAIECGPEVGPATAVQLQRSGATNGPAGRSGHSLVAIPNASGGGGGAFAEFALFGGLTPLPQPRHYGDLWLLSVHRACCGAVAARRGTRHAERTDDLIRWTQPPTTGTGPSPRSDHSTCVVGRQMLVVGGAAAPGPLLGDAFVLSLDTFAWMPVAMPHAFVPREMAACVALPSLARSSLHGEVALLFGGRAADALLGDAWIIRCTAGRDSSSGNGGGESTKKEEAPQLAASAASARPAPARCCHAATVLLPGRHRRRLPSDGQGGGRQGVGEEKEPDGCCRVLISGGFSSGDHGSDILLRVACAEEEQEEEKEKEGTTAAAVPVVVDAVEAPRKHARSGANLLLGFGHSAASLDGRIFAVGGIQVNDIGSSMQLFEFAALEI